MDDRLSDIFHWQAMFNDHVRQERHLDFSRSEWLQKEAMALMVELAEVVEETRFKWWKNTEPIDDAKLHEELVDVLHFFISLCLDAGLDADRLYQGYLAKNQENFRRQQGLSDKPGYGLAGEPKV